MSSYSKSDILVGLLLLGCLVLLYCSQTEGLSAARKNPDRREGMVYLPGLHFKPAAKPREGMYSDPRISKSLGAPGLHFRSNLNNQVNNRGKALEGYLPTLVSDPSSLGYVRPKLNLEGLADNAPVHDLHDLPQVGNQAVQKVNKAVDESKWAPEADIQLDHNQLTLEDQIAGREKYGSEQLLDLYQAKRTAQKRDHSISHSGDVLIRTDYGPDYGDARGSVTF